LAEIDPYPAEFYRRGHPHAANCQPVTASGRLPGIKEHCRDARGNQHKAIIMTEHTASGQPLPSARTFELDQDRKIKAERVVFFGPAV
jgi:hypothetical protein